MLPVGTQLFPDEIIAVLHSIPNYDLDASGAESMTANQLVIEENMGGSVAERVAGVITTHTTGFSASIEQTSDIGIQPVLGISPPPPQPPRFIKAPALATLQPVIQAVVQPQVTIPSFTIPPPQLMMQQPVVPAVVMGSIPPMYQQQQQQFQQVGYQYYQPMHMQQQQMQPQLGMPQYPMGMNMMTPGMSPYGQLPMLIPPPVVGDPMNDMSSWSEHESEDKRKYWYNRVNGTSTYDKPFCLKTPEERSIPHCKWKEYTSADDKKYYSDGKESSWTMPEEFKLWRERMDAVELKKLAMLTASNNSNNISSNSSSNSSNNGKRIQNSAAGSAVTANTKNGNGINVHSDGPGSGINTGVNPSSNHHGKRKNNTDEFDSHNHADVTYNTVEEAVDAFKAMLSDRKIQTTMKMKEVTDICHTDVRYKALKTAGERKQALAEYQTKSLKHEKEAQKSKARKSRDHFLIMLAENTGIDARTRWREAVQLLQDDVRYTDVEDGPEREDLFNDFVSELEKKEREDRIKQKSSAIKYLNNLITDEKENGILSRKSTWADSRENYLKRSELRSLEDMEVKRIFQDHVGKLDFIYKEDERCKKIELQKKIDTLSESFKELLEKLAGEGLITARSRWQDCCLKSEICNSVVYKELDSLFSPERNADKDRDKDREKERERDRKDGNSFSSSSNSSGTNSSSGGGGGASGDNSISNGYSATTSIGSVRDTFDRVLVLIREAARADKRLIQEVLKDWQYELKHNSTFIEFQDVVYIAAGIKLKVNTEVAVNVSITEEGEELEENVDDRTKSGFGKQLRYMLAKRPFALEGAYKDLIDEEMRRYKKKEERFLLLLEGYFSEHSLISWDETKRSLGRHPDLMALEKRDRELIYSSFSLKKTEMKSKRLHESKMDEKKDDKIDKHGKGGRSTDRNDMHVHTDGRTEKTKAVYESEINDRSRREATKDRRGKEERERNLSEGEISCENEGILHSNEMIMESGMSEEVREVQISIKNVKDEISSSACATVMDIRDINEDKFTYNNIGEHRNLETSHSHPYSDPDPVDLKDTADTNRKRIRSFEMGEEENAEDRKEKEKVKEMEAGEEGEGEREDEGEVLEDNNPKKQRIQNL